MGLKEWKWLTDVLDVEQEVTALREEVNDGCQKIIDLGRELRRSQEERTWLAWELAQLQQESDRLRHSNRCLKAQVVS